MAINFPTGASGEYYNYNGRVWQYNGYAWVFLGISGATGATGSDGATGATGSLAASQTTGTVLTFLSDSVYGTIGLPETGGISADVSGGLLGVTNIVIHSNGPTGPTFSSEFKRLSGSGVYATGQINYIYCTYINSTNIIYSINQAT